MKKIIIPTLLIILASCKKEKTPAINYRQEMRNFVQGISLYARSIKPGFIIIPQNGHQLLTIDGNPNGQIAASYIQAINGIGREDLFYGYENDDVLTPAEVNNEMLPFMELAKTVDCRYWLPIIVPHQLK